MPCLCFAKETGTFICEVYDIVITDQTNLQVLSSSLTHIPVKVGPFNAKIQNEKDFCTRRLIYLLK